MSNRRAQLSGYGIALLLLSVFSLQMMRSVQHIEGLRPPKPGAKAPLFELATDSEGTRVSLDSLKGQVVVLDFFATWCSPCETSMPQLEVFASKHTGSLSVIAISLDAATDEAKARAMAQSLLPSSTFVMADGIIEHVYAVSTIPHLVVIDKEGIVHKVFRGAHSKGMANELEKATQSLW